jgi:L-lactate dehydrogenase
MSDCRTKHMSKVAIIGAGMVGSSCAYAMLIKGVSSEIVIVDVNADKASGEAMDLNHGIAFAKPVKIVSGTYDDCAGADIVIITVGAARKPGESRLDLVNRNVSIFKSIIPEIEKAAPDAIVLVVTNPVDIMTYVTLKLSSYPKEKVVGSGTLLDSSRLRYLIAEHCGVDPRNVHGYMLGEHGDSAVPAWSLTNIGGTRLDTICAVCKHPCDGRTRRAIVDEVKGAGARIIKAKGATYYAIGLALVDVVETVLRDENSVMPLSCLLDGHLGIRDVCLSIPVVLGRAGISRLLDVQLEDDEKAGLHNSAALLRDVLDKINIFSHR